MLAEARNILRLSTEAFDTEIQGLIDACITDLQLVGVKRLDMEDPLIKRAIFTYVKSHFGYEDPNSRILRDYAQQKLSLRDSVYYRAEIGSGGAS